MDVRCHPDEGKVGRMYREEDEAKTSRKARVEEDHLGKLEFDKLAKELQGMSSEICGIKKLYEEVESGLHRKELLLNQISSSNEKILKLEGENRDVALSSDEAFARIQDLEKKTAANSDEICGLKRLISVIQMNSGTHTNASLDQEDQFLHLEEAHRKQQTLFQASEPEWQREKSSLLDEISTLQGTLDARIRAEEKANFELQNRTSEVETTKTVLQKSEQERASLLAALNDKDAHILNLEQQISMLNSVILAKSKAAEMLNQEKDKYFRLAEDRNCIIKDLHNEVDQLRKKLAEREVTHAAIFDANNTLGEENERLIPSIKEKDQKIQQFQKEAMISLAEKDGMLNAALEEAEGRKIIEVEEKTWVIAKEMEFQEKPLLQLSEKTEKTAIQELRSQLEKETRLFENLLEELESHKHVLLEDGRNEKIGRESFLAELENMCKQIGLLCSEDAELMSMMRKSSQFKDMLSSVGLNDTFSPSRKSVQVSLGERHPLAELNVNPIQTAKQMD